MWAATKSRLRNAWPAFRGRRTNRQTIYDIAAMSFVWIAAFVFFRVAIPEALGDFLTDQAGNYITDQGGKFLMTNPNPYQIIVQSRYLWWGDLAMVLLTIGSVMQVKAQGR